MGGFEKLVDTMVNSANANNPINDGDYVGEDGLLYCGLCHTRKQIRLEMLGREITPMVPCKCRSEEIRKEEEAEKQRIKDNEVSQMKRAGFPDYEMANWTFENDDGGDPKTISIAKRYVEKFQQMKADHKGLLLFGTVGTGKTYASACIANALIEKGIPCLVTNFTRLINTMQGLREGRQEFLDDLNDYDLLVIDDLAAERDTEYMQEFVMQIIDSRSRSGLPIIVTTNLTATELKNPSDMQKQRIYSRLLGMCIPIEVKGKDRRKASLVNDYKKYEELLGLEDVT